MSDVIQRILELKTAHAAELTKGENIEATKVAEEIILLALNEKPKLDANGQHQLQTEIFPIIQWLTEELERAEKYRDEVNSIINKAK